MAARGRPASTVRGAPTKSSDGRIEFNLAPGTAGGRRRRGAKAALRSGSIGFPFLDSIAPTVFSIVDRESRRATGLAAFMRIEPTHRVIEVGSILFTNALQRTRGATEAMYLMARYVFEELEYRRYEWKCNALNAASRRAALRLGFGFEGVFRQHMIVKGRSRDTAWYSMIDAEWPARKAAFERWLSPDNFHPDSRQKTPLTIVST